MRALGEVVAAVALLVASVVPATAQDGTPATGAVERDVLFAIDVPAAAVPDPLTSVYFASLSVEPGVDGVIGAGKNGFRG